VVDVENGKKQYSASRHPRHIANNWGGERIPVLGDASPHTPRNKEEYNELLKKIPSVCAKIEQDFIDLCQKYQEISTSGTKRKQQVKRHGKSSLDDHANSFLASVKDLGGKGVAHVFALNFVQMVSVFGFIPTKIKFILTINLLHSSGCYNTEFCL